MRRWRTAWWLAALLAAAVAAGCLPNRVAISPDGRTMYFSLGPQGPFGGGGGLSNIYSLQIETAEMQALTDGPGAKTWCMPTDGAKRLAYMELPVAAGERAIRLLDLETGQDIPLTGALQPHMYPWAIPDREPRLLAIREGADAEPYWALYGEKGLMALPLPEGAKAVLGNVGVAPDRFAVAVSKDVKLPADAQGAEKDGHEYQVFVVDLAAGPAAEGEEEADAEAKAEVNATAVARWLVEKEPVVDLAFSEDGSRLVAAVLEDPTVFYELDVTGQAEPKRLFECLKAYYPQAAPDGGAVYLRTSAADEGWREVVLWRPDGPEQVLARLPGKLGEAYTTWRWLEDGRLRVYHLSNEGVRIIETAADGSEAKARRLSGDNLMALKYAADLKRGIARTLCVSEGECPEALAEKLKPVLDPLGQIVKSGDDAFEQAQQAAAVWEEVPAVPEIEAPAAAAPAAEKPAEEPAAP